MTRLSRALALLVAAVGTAGCVSHPSKCLVGTHADPLGSLTAGVLAIPLLPIGLVASVPCLGADEPAECHESVMDFVVAPAIGVATVLCWITSAPLALGDAWFESTKRTHPPRRSRDADDTEPPSAPEAPRAPLDPPAGSA